MKDSLDPTRYIDPTLESFCDSLIREKDNLIHLGMISNAATSVKALLSQSKEKSKPTKKQNFRNNKQNNKGLKPSQSASSLKNDKGSKPKEKKTERHCNYCGKDNHDESKCFKKMAALEAAMKKHHIILYSSLESPLMDMHFVLLVILMLHHLLLLQMNGSLILEHLIIWPRIKTYFLLCMNVTPTNICW